MMNEHVAVGHFVFFAKISIRGECIWHLEFMRWQTIVVLPFLPDKEQNVSGKMRDDATTV